MNMMIRAWRLILAFGATTWLLGGCNNSPDLPASITLGGTVTGSSSAVTVVNNGGDSTTISANGTFVFSTRQRVSSVYAVAVLTQPVGQTCVVTGGSGTAGSSDITTVSVACTDDSSTLGGTISGLSGTVVLQQAGVDSLSISSNGVFVFPIAIAQGATYAVSVKTQPAGGTCTVAQGSGVSASSSVTDISVTCVADSFTTGGIVSGLIGSVVLQNNLSETLSLSTDGSFAFATPVGEGMPYAVTVSSQPVDQTCSVGSGSGTVGGGRVTNVTVVCSTNTFSVGGTVAGLTNDLVLQNDAGDPITLRANGVFTFVIPVAQGGTYAVTVRTQPATQTCTVANSTGTLGAANVSSVIVTCATNAHLIGGTVSGLGGTVILLDNSGDSLPLGTDGLFTFASPVAEGSPYHVTVQTQPANQVCTAVNAAGTTGGSDVTNVIVSCVTDTTLTASATGTIPVNNGTGTITVTNTGAYTATNVIAMLPGGWTAVTQDATNCAALAPNGGTCTLSFASTAPYVAQGGIVVGGDNVSSPPGVAIAFTIQGYLVFSVDSAVSASVIDTADLAVDQWGNDTVATGAQSLTDGPANTSTIDGSSGVGASDAIHCHDSISGAAAVGTWYLPAICQMGGAVQGAGCSTGLANIDTNLVQLGFGGFGLFYWSSSEYGASPASAAWAEVFYSSGNSFQGFTDKSFNFSVRCARSISY